MYAIGKSLAIGLGAASFLVVPVANAQNQSASPPPSSSPSTTTPETTVKPSDISDKKLDAAAAAVKKVSTVSDSYKKKLAQAPDSEKEKIRDDADRDVTKAVTDQGLSVEEYIGIMKVAQNDTTVRSKLMDRLK
ncbi:MAG: DUF4168 domain-containing protein [Rhodospirillaceae bacterium]